MNTAKTLILVLGLAAIATGCANNKNHKHGKSTATTKPVALSERATTRPSVAAAEPIVPSDKLAGAWSLAMPRRGAQKAKITVTDETHVTIQAGENLSGNYVVQGEYLLILTRDEQRRPLAWRINSPDSLTVVRTSETGDFTGTTLIRAAATAEADSQDDAAAAEPEDEAAAADMAEVQGE
jgi:hypothetical protein